MVAYVALSSLHPTKPPRSIPIGNRPLATRHSPLLPARLPRSLLGNAADPRPASQLGLDVIPVKITVSEQDHGVKDKISHFLDEVLASRVAGFVASLDNLGGFLDNLHANPVDALFHQAGDIGLLRLGIALAIGDHGHEVRHDRGFRHRGDTSELESTCGSGQAKLS